MESGLHSKIDGTKKAKNIAREKCLIKDETTYKKDEQVRTLLTDDDDDDKHSWVNSPSPRTQSARPSPARGERNEEC